MDKYIVGPIVPTKIEQAGAKFPFDVMIIASKVGYKSININEGYSLKRIYKFALDFLKLTVIKRNSVVIYIDRVDQTLSRMMVYWVLKKKNAQVIPLIEDIDVLRTITDRKIIENEILRLKFSKVIISQNYVMSDYIKMYLKKCNTVNLEILDFISEKIKNRTNVHKGNKWVITYGGNLSYSQSGFIYNLPQYDNIKFYVYGVNVNEDLLPEYIAYRGFFEANECVNKLDGDWGLVWNGETLYIDENNLKSQYYNYVCPHKLSMYLLCGMPVIVYENSAMAKYVKNHDCGIVIKNIEQIPEIINQISNERYISILENVYKVANELSKGLNLERAIIEAERIIIS